MMVLLLLACSPDADAPSLEVLHHRAEAGSAADQYLYAQALWDDYNTVELLLEVEFGDAQLDQLRQEVRHDFLANNLGYQDLRVEEDAVRFHLRNLDERAAVQERLQGFLFQINEAGDANINIDIDDGGEVLVTLTEEFVRQQSERAVSGTIAWIIRMTEEMSGRSPLIEPHGCCQISLKIVGGTSGEWLLRAHRHHYPSNGLELRMVDASVSIEAALEGNVPPGSEILHSSNGSEFLTLVRRRTLMDNRIFSTEVRRKYWIGPPSVVVQLDYHGIATYDRISRENIGASFAVVLDDLIIHTQQIERHVSDGRLDLTGDFTREQAEDLAALLWYQDPRMAPLVLIEENVHALDNEEGLAEVLLWFERAANRGSVEAQLELAKIYSNGWRVEEDQREVLFWCSLANALATEADQAQTSLCERIVEENDLSPEEITAVQQRITEWRAN